MPALLQYMRLSVLHPSSKHVPNTILWPSFAAMEYTHCLSNAFQPSYYELAVKKMSHSYLYLDSLRLHRVGAFYICSDVGDIQCFCNWHESKVNISSSEKQTCNDEAQVDIFNESLNSLCDKDQKEMARRRKIGLANKGRVPWNKGRKHSAETRVRIKQRTIEALRDPKVRKKMADHHLAHSDETKARIGSALKHVWAKRLRWKQLGEKFLLSWSKSITKAAKDGGNDQRELDWDSYDKIKQELALQQLQWATEKAKAKEMAKIMAEQAALARAEKAAQKKAEKMARLAEKRKEREEKAKARRERKRKERRKKEKNGEFSVSQGLKLKRLIKIHKKKSVNVPASIRGNIVDSHVRAWEKFDVDLIKKEKMQREVSLADQIQAAKNKRAETIAKEILPASSSNHPQSVKCGSDSQLQFMQHK